MSVDGENPNKGRKKHYSPLKGRAIPFNYAHVKERSGAASDPKAYSEYQGILKKEHTNYKAAINSIRQNPSTVSLIAGPEKFRNKYLEAKNRNKVKGTNYKGENLSKISSKEFGGVASHTIQDKSGKTWGDKPVHGGQRSKENAFKNASEFTKEGSQTGLQPRNKSVANFNKSFEFTRKGSRTGLQNTPEQPKKSALLKSKAEGTKSAEPKQSTSNKLGPTKRERVARTSSELRTRDKNTARPRPQRANASRPSAPKTSALKRRSPSKGASALKGKTSLPNRAPSRNRATVPASALSRNAGASRGGASRPSSPSRSPSSGGRSGGGKSSGGGGKGKSK